VEHLTTFDAGFLGAEDSDQRISLAIGGVAVLEGPIPDLEVLIATLEQRISTCPRFAQRLRRRPFDLGPPEWVDAIDFNLAHHVRRIALPRPGDDADLYQLVADVMSRRLDRSRPLWEIWVIEGLDNGRWAMLMKVHHCIADGIATAHMLEPVRRRHPRQFRQPYSHRHKPPRRPHITWIRRQPGQLGEPTLGHRSRGNDNYCACGPRRR
jgi:diacylglycerol O-acyltransferase